MCSKNNSSLCTSLNYVPVKPAQKTVTDRVLRLTKEAKDLFPSFAGQGEVDRQDISIMGQGLQWWGHEKGADRTLPQSEMTGACF